MTLAAESGYLRRKGLCPAITDVSFTTAALPAKLVALFGNGCHAGQTAKDKH